MGDRTAMTGEWLAHCGACPVPEIANVFHRARIDFHQVTGMLHDDPVCWKEVDAWIDAARVASIMFHNRLGLMGHYYGGMLDIYSDITQQCATFGGHIEIIEVDELAALRRDVTAAQIAGRASRISIESSTCSPIARRRNWNARRAPRWRWTGWWRNMTLGSLAYYYMGAGNAENEDAISSIILGNSLLTARGIPVAGEYEIKNAQAMKIMDTFGAGGSFTEYYAHGFQRRRGAHGPRRPRPHRHRPGQNQSAPAHGLITAKSGADSRWKCRVKHGPVTLLSVVRRPGMGSLKLCVAEGESVPGRSWKSATPTAAIASRIGARQFRQRLERPRPGASLRRRRGTHRRTRSKNSANCSAWRQRESETLLDVPWYGIRRLSHSAL